jgi:hypothetical protein
MTHLELKFTLCSNITSTLQASLESFPRELQDFLLPASSKPRDARQRGSDIAVGRLPTRAIQSVSTQSLI